MKKLIGIITLSFLLVSCSSWLNKLKESTDQLNNFKNIAIDSDYWREVDRKIKELEDMIRDSKYDIFKETLLGLYSYEIRQIVKKIESEKDIKNNPKCINTISEIYDSIKEREDLVKSLPELTNNSNNDLLFINYQWSLASVLLLMSEIYMIPFCSLDFLHNNDK